MSMKKNLFLKSYFFSLSIFLFTFSQNILFSQSSRSNYMKGMFTSTIANKHFSAQSFLPIYQKGYTQLEIDMIIGSETEDENYIFSQPVKVCVDSKENIYVLDFQENCIKKYDTLGKYVKTISRAGKGPGEILNPSQMSIDSNDNIVTWDFGNMRLSFFSNDGDFLHSFNTTELIRLPEMIYNFKIGPDGHIYIETHISDYSGEAGGTLVKIIQFSQDFKDKRIIASARIKDNIYITKPVFTNVPVPFVPKLFWDIAPSGNIIIANSKDYTLEIFSPKIKLLHKVQHNAPKISVTEEDKKIYFDSMMGGISGGTASEGKMGAPDFIRRETKFPEFKPYFRYLIFDHEGYILIPTYEKENENYIYDVFTPDGNFLNRFKLPLLGLSIVAKGFIYELKTSKDGFPSIVRYRLR